MGGLGGSHTLASGTQPLGLRIDVRTRCFSPLCSWRTPRATHSKAELTAQVGISNFTNCKTWYETATSVWH